MSLVDTMPVPAAIAALVRLPLLHREALQDFSAGHAYRSVCHAVGP